MSPGSGPNLEFFITAKTERHVTDRNAAHVFGHLQPVVLRSNESPPPSYPQVRIHDFFPQALSHQCQTLACTM